MALGFLGQIAPPGTPVDDGSGDGSSQPPARLPESPRKVPTSGARDVGSPWQGFPRFIVDPNVGGGTGTPPPPPPPTTTVAPPLVCGAGYSKLAAGMTRTYRDGTTVHNDSDAPICAPIESAAPTSAPNAPATTTAPAPAPQTVLPSGTTGASATGGAADTGLITSLMGLLANQYAGAGVNGGGSGFTGTVAAPIAPDATGGSDTQATPNHRLALLALAVAVVAGGVWYWRKHHKGK